jgi:hypothetical protein
MRFMSKGAFSALVAMLALSAVGISSAAAALPEFQKEGKPLAETVKFTSAGTEAFVETGGGSDTCTASITGETKGSTEVAKVGIKFEKCKNGWPCVAFEAKELKGKLGYIGKGVAGLLLEPSSGLFATCTAGSRRGEFKGSVIGEVRPINKAGTKFTLEYNETGGYQELTHFEGEALIHQLEANVNGTFADFGMGYEPELVMSKTIEIKA